MDILYFLSYLLIVSLSFIIAICLSLAINNVPSTFTIYLSKFNLLLPIEISSEKVHGLVFDDLSLSVNSPRMILSESNKLPPINNSNTFFTKGLMSTVLSPDSSYLTNDSAGLSSLQQLPQQQLDNLSRHQNQILQKNVIYQYPKLISGSWVLNVSQGLVTDFHTNFKMVKINGFDKHFVEILNFKNADKSSIMLDQFSNTTIDGFVDIKIDNQLFKENIPLTIKIFQINTIALAIEDEVVANLFYHSPLLGLMDSFKDFENDQLLAYEE